MSHCHCCYAACPVPMLEVCQLRHKRPNTSSDNSYTTAGGWVYSTYEVPDADQWRRYKTKQAKITHSSNISSQGSYYPDCDQTNGLSYYQSSLFTASGSVTRTYSLDEEDCQELDVCNGELVTIGKSWRRGYGNPENPENPGCYDTTYLSSSRRWGVKYGAGQTVPNPAYDSGEPTSPSNPVNLTTKANQGVYTYKYRSYASDGAQTGAIDEEVIVTGLGAAGTVPWYDNGQAYDRTVTTTNTLTSHKVIDTLTATLLTGSAKLTEEDAWEEPWEGRYRIVIPHGFGKPPLPDPVPDPILESHEQRWHGTYHRVQLLETFTPEDYDPEDGTSPQPVVTSAEVEWIGPGDVIEFDGYDDLTDEEKAARVASWQTDWVVMEVPSEAGESTVDRVRSQCYHGAPWAKHS